MALLYASPTGAGDGLTPSTPGPLATAKALARAAPGSTVFLRGGRYDLSTAPLTLSVLDSSTTWQSYAGELPILDGGTLVTGWTLHDAGSNIWQAALTPGTFTRQLWVNGSRATRARASDAVRLSFSTSDSGYHYSSASAPAFARPQDLEIVSWRPATFANWLQNRLRVASASVVGGTTTLTIDPDAAAFLIPAQGGLSTQPWALENAYEFLTPGSWYLDPGTSTLYYVPRTGEDMATASVRLPLAETVLTLDGVTDLTFRGVAIETTVWNQTSTQRAYIDAGGQGCYTKLSPTSWAPGKIPVAVQASGVSRVAFARCAFQHLGASGLGVVGSGADVTVQGCVFTDAGAQAWNIGSETGFYERVLNRSNYVHDICIEVPKSAAQTIAVAHSQALHNHVEDVPYSGIITATDTQGVVMKGNEIAYNRVLHAMLVLEDGSALYAYGPGALTQAGVERSSIHHNYSTVSRSGDQVRSIYLDNGTTSWDVHDNVSVTSCTNWLYTQTDSADNVASNNYATAGAANGGGGTNTIAAAIALTGTDPAGWPSEAQAVYESTGLDAEDAGLLTWDDSQDLLTFDPLVVGLPLTLMRGSQQIQMMRGSRKIVFRRGP